MPYEGFKPTVSAFKLLSPMPHTAWPLGPASVLEVLFFRSFKCLRMQQVSCFISSPVSTGRCWSAFYTPLMTSLTLDM
jgi:hypothetical protein